MKIENYFKKYGYICGVRSEYTKGRYNRWEYVGFIFSDLDVAKKWLTEETESNCKRELMSMSAAEKMCGKKAYRFRYYYIAPETGQLRCGTPVFYRKE